MNSLLYKYKKKQRKELDYHVLLRMVFSSVFWEFAIVSEYIHPVSLFCSNCFENALNNYLQIDHFFLSRELDKVGLVLATQLIMYIGNLREFLKLAFPALALRQTESRQIF